MKTTKITALFLAVCLLLSGCFSNGRYSENSQSIIEQEEELSANIEITPVIPESSESSSSEPEPLPEEDPAIENNIGSLEELSPYFQEFADLGSEQVPWGPGTNFDETGKPIACIDLQAKYSKWDADFYREGEEHKGKVYLTFDEGYENGYTPKILDVLKEKGVELCPEVRFLGEF